ncbi:GtrA family protein [Pedomonas mirosovicensis]|uniref:GtrA family protein n=1 Tax=Pedomonas mirosovicensis TaxID=2908641 RepID=UPI002166ED4D|nr:GtrA family protein [Pedomonas mirosovicensis]MCH8684758.1 GtrA family protein [Pedomonas mirosovicensis]
MFKRLVARLAGLPRLPRYLLVGHVGFQIDALVTLLLTQQGGVDARLSRIPAFLIASIATYALNRYWTFGVARAEGKFFRGWAAYLVATAVGALCNYLAYAAVVTYHGDSFWNQLAALVAGSFAGLAVSYFANSRFVFASAKS